LASGVLPQIASEGYLSDDAHVDGKIPLYLLASRSAIRAVFDLSALAIFTHIPPL
jgi:hypothetical protein